MLGIYSAVDINGVTGLYYNVIYTNCVYISIREFRTSNQDNILMQIPLINS